MSQGLGTLFFYYDTFSNCFNDNTVHRQLLLECRRYGWLFYIVSFASDISEDPFSSRQEESSEGLTPNTVLDRVLQRNRELSFTPRDNQAEVFSRPARSFITEEILEALRKADRKGRDVVVGLSNACCKWGCSKSEISSLCWESTFAISVNTPADILYILNRYINIQTPSPFFSSFHLRSFYIQGFFS